MMPSSTVTRCPHVVGVRCNWCSKERPEHRVHRLQSNQVLCDYCLEWHIAAHAFLGGGDIPERCQECNREFTFLEGINPRPVRIFVVPKDSILQVLCATCILPYAAKRSDIYRDTEFWKDIAT